MIFWTIVGLGVLFTIIVTVTSSYDFSDYIIIPIGGVIATALVLLCTYLPGCWWADQYSEVEYTSTANLEAMQMGEQTRGTAFLGSGYVNETNSYTYFYENENGNLQSGRIDADEAEIVQSDTETPRIETHHWQMPWWWGPMDMVDTYTVYVPEGSIKPLINLDLPK